MKKIIFIIICFLTLACFSPSSLAQLGNCYPSTCPVNSNCVQVCNNIVTTCQDLCLCVSNAETGNSSNSSTTLGHITEEFRKHRLWMDRVFFGDATRGDPPGLLGAMQLMTEQLTTSSMQQASPSRPWAPPGWPTWA